MPVHGGITGIANIGISVVSIEIIPSKIGGTIGGISVFWEYIFKAFDILVIGLLWHNAVGSISYSWLWITQSISFVICLINTLIIILLAR